MDKPEFVEKAPLYYALAIIVTMPPSPSRLIGISNVVASFINGAGFDKLTVKIDLIRRAMIFLQSEGLVDIVEDDFGPTMYAVNGDIVNWIKSESASKYEIFNRYNKINELNWLNLALMNIVKQYATLGIVENDFIVERSEIQWTPIPLERENTKLIAAERALEIAIKEIEGDNGYAVHSPNEREHVLVNLKSLQKKLAEDVTIYWIKLKYLAFEPLAAVIRRFGDAATGVASTAAREALIEWLKSAGQDLARWIFG
jgi:hypothetical protein